MAGYARLHQEFVRLKHGWQRPDATYEHQGAWLNTDHALLVTARAPDDGLVAAAFWIIYGHGAYYASGPSLQPNAQKAVLWQSLRLLRARGLHLAEFGRVDGETEKERNIAHFKCGWGGTTVPFLFATRKESP